MVKKNLCGMTSEEIFHLIRPKGFTISHAVVIANSIYRKRIAEIPLINKIPAKLRIELADNACSGIFKPATFEVSADRTVKYLFRTETGKEFETVYIPDNKRVTVCVSTQSGCRMGCPFCITARYGFRGNLSAGEILNQILSIPDSEKITHVVFMGMGEPLDNLENVLKACEIITAGWGMALSPRNVTVSTVGITSGVEMFLGNSDCNLTLSLYSPFPEERKKVVPAEKHNPALRIIEIMKNYPVRKKRRLSLAYIMINGLNDSEKHLDSLITLLKGSAIRVNLIPYNPSGHDLYTSSSADRMQNFRHRLVISGVSASVRKSRGIDISAACGQLAAGLIS